MGSASLFIKSCTAYLPLLLATMSQSNSTANATLTVNLSSTHDGIIIPVVFSFLATLSVIARLVSRRMQKLSFALDDILLVFAWVYLFSSEAQRKL